MEGRRKIGRTGGELANKTKNLQPLPSLLATVHMASAQLALIRCDAVNLKGSRRSGRSEGIEQGGKGREEAGRSCGQQRI